MSGDPNRLRAYHLAHGFVLAVFRGAGTFPREQRYIIKQQLQRAALSTACNLVEGCSRERTGEHRHFVNIALGSAREAQYLVALSTELRYLSLDTAEEWKTCCRALVGCLQNLAKSLEHLRDVRTSP